MKRFLALFLTLLLLVPCLTIPASATTQGVIDAIEDLQAGLGTSQRDILDAIYDMWDGLTTDIWYVIDSIDDNFIDLIDGVLVPIKESFESFIKYWSSSDYTYTRRRFRFANGGYNLMGEIVTGTRFQADLYTHVVSPMQDILDQVYQTLCGDTTKSDQFQEDIAPLETEFDEMGSVMETAPTVSVDELDVWFSEIDSDFQNMFLGETSYLGTFFEEIFYGVLLDVWIYVFILATLGYLLYGKRG